VAIACVKDNAIAFGAIDRAAISFHNSISRLAADAAIDFILKKQATVIHRARLSAKQKAVNAALCLPLLLMFSWRCIAVVVDLISTNHFFVLTFVFL
jgi:hypothetical protein